jgi:hypothetical protein
VSRPRLFRSWRPGCGQAAETGPSAAVRSLPPASSMSGGRTAAHTSAPRSSVLARLASGSV